MANVSDLLQAAASGPAADAAPAAAPAPAPTWTPTAFPTLGGKVAEVAAATDEKKVEMGGMPDRQTFLNAAAIRHTGSGLTSAPPIERDLATLTPDQLVAKYGPQVGGGMVSNLISAGDTYRTQLATEMSHSQLLHDAFGGVAMGVINTVGGLGALASGVVSPKFGVELSKQLQAINDQRFEESSPALKAHTAANTLKSALDFRDNAAESNDSFTGKLAQIGRDALSTVKNTASDPVLLSDVTSQALGSILIPGKVADALGAASEALIPKAIAKVLPNKMMASVGLLEGSGAYQQTAAEVGNMDFADLEKTSPAYRDLVSQGMSPEDARTQVASKSALLAAATAAPAGMVEGKISEGFLEHPFAVKSLSHAGSNLAKETVEETLQGASGQLAQNVGEKAYADPNKDLTDGVGEQAGLGAIGGIGAAGVTQAPGIASHALSLAGKTAMNAVLNRVGSLQSVNDAKSPVSDAKVAAAGEQAVQMAQDLHDQTQAAQAAPPTEPQAEVAAATGAPAAPEASNTPSPMEALSSKLLDTAKFDPSDLSHPGLSPEVKSDLDETTNRLQAVLRLGKEVNDKGADHPEGLAAASEMRDQINKYEEVIKNADPQAMADIPDDSPAGILVNHFNTIADRIEQNPTVNKALLKVRGLSDDQITKLIGGEPTQEKAINAATIASQAPEKVPADISQLILQHASDGKFDLSQDQRQALGTSLAVMSAAQNAHNEQAKLGHNTPLDDVTHDILSQPGAKSSGKRSAVSYAVNIYRAMKAGNLDAAKAQMSDLGDLVQHLSNKVQAVNANYDQGGGPGVPFQSLHPDTREWFDSKAPIVHHKNSGSIELAQRISLDAQRLSDVYNGLSKTFPELKAGNAEPNSLHPSLSAAKPEKIAQAHRDGDLVRPPLVREAQPKAATPIEAIKERAQEPEQEQKAKAEATPGEGSPRASEEKSDQGAPAEETPPKTEETQETEATPAQVYREEQPTEAKPQASTTETAKSDKASTGAEAAVEDTTPKTVKEAYPDLHEPEDKPNAFHKAFTIAKAGSRLLGLKNPVQTLKNALRSEGYLQEFMGERRRGGLTKAVSSAYRALLDTVPDIRDTLNARLASKLAEKRETGKFAGNTFADLLDKGVLGTFPEGMVTHLTEKQTDGSFKYNQDLIDHAITAGLQWLLVSDNFRSDMDADLVSRLTGIESDKAEQFVTMLDKGLSPVEAVRSLSDKIVDFWGLQKNNNASKSFTDGIANAMAAELLLALTHHGALKIERFVREGDDLRPVEKDEDTGKKRTVQRLVLAMDRGTEEEPNPLFVDPTVLEEASLREPKDREYYDEDKIPVAKTQMRNPLVNLSVNQKDMIGAAQGDKHFLHEVMFGLYKAIGGEGLNVLFGGGNLKNRPLNEQHKLTLEGQNQTVGGAWQALSARVSKMQGFGQPLGEIAIRYAYNVSSVGRLQMLGAQNPQASKLVREAILNTWSKIDLSNQDHQTLFKTAIAQALGVKIHAKSTESVLAKVGNLLDTKFTDTLDMLDQHLKGGGLPSTFLEQVKSDFKSAGVELTPNALHALTEFARSQGVEGEFHTPLYIEADGVTNGLVNAIHMLTTDRFTGDQIDNLAKGGLFLDGGKTQTMNEHRVTGEGSIDLYSKGSSKTKTNIENLRNKVSPEVKTQMDHLLSLLALVVPKVTYDATKGSITIDRGVTKNPMTITIYGSGAKGIAGKITQAVAEGIYERLSDVAQAKHDGRNDFHSALFGDKSDPEASFKTFVNSLSALVETVPKRGPHGLYLSNSKAEPLNKIDATKFKLDSSHFDAIQQNILHFFVNPMRGAITDTVGESLMKSMTLVQRTTQAQSIVLQHLFRQQVSELIAKNGKLFPSENQLQKIREGLLKISPLIDTGDQKFFPANTSSGDFDNELGRALDNRLGTPAQVYGPANAGVKGSPMLNIGMGDGFMIQKMLTGGAKGLPVFDGFNFPLDQVRDGSRLANQAASEAWQNNQLRAVKESFDTFMEHLTSEMISADDALHDDLEKALFGTKEGEAHHTAEQIMGNLRAKAAELAAGADAVDARHAALAKVQSYNDQMAGAQSPHINKGEVLTGSSEEIAKALNSKLDGEKPSQARELPVSSIDLAMKGAKLLPEQRGIWNHIVKTGVLKDFRIVAGTREEVEAHRAKDQLSMPELSDATKGFIDLRSKTIYLVGSGEHSPETMLHEAIHAATFNAILEHYEGKGSSSLVRDAVTRLEALRDQFLKLEPYDQPASFYDASQTVRDAMERGDPIGQATALNEFMAWSLANKDLAKVLKKETLPTNSLARMAKEVWENIKKLVFGKTSPKVGEDMYSNLVFNTRIVVNEQPSVSEMNRDTMLFQHPIYGEDARLTSLNERFDDVLGRLLKTNDPVQRLVQRASIKGPIADSLELTSQAQAHGFAMTPQAAKTFRRISLALALEAKLEPSSLAGMGALYEHVTQHLSPTDLGQDKFDFLMNTAGAKTDRQGRSSLLPVFMGLAVVDDGLRDALRKMDLPKGVKNTAGTLDALLENLASKGMDSLSHQLSAQRNATNVTEAVDALTDHIAQSAIDTEGWISRAVNKGSAGVNTLNDGLLSWIESISDKTIDKANEIQNQTKSRLVKNVATFAEGMARLATEKNASEAMNSLQNMANKAKLWTPVRDVINDIIGRTQSNAPIFDLIRTIRQMMSQMKKGFQETLPKTIAEQFTQKLSKEVWNHLHTGFGKTDLAALTSHHDNAEVLEMIAGPRKRAATTQALETQIQKMDPAHFDLVKAKAQQLANFMLTGETGKNLLKNANAVANLLLEKTKANRTPPTKEYVQAVDRLTTLYALDQLPKETRKAISSLVQSEAKGLDFTLSYLTGLRRDETAKAEAEGGARFNARKGYIPASRQDGVSLVVADDAKSSKLLEQSYVRLGDYKGSKAEGNLTSRGYYFAPASARSSFAEGLLQNVKSTAGGVDVRNGFSEGPTAGRITGRAEVARITKVLAREGESKTENLVPVFNRDGKVVAYERSLDPARLKSLNEDSHLAHMMGAWRSRQAEEEVAQTVNRQVVERLHEVYKSDLKKSLDNEKAFVDLWATKDPILKDAVANITDETRGYIQEAFGDRFMVRRDMVNDIPGYRNASIGDAWTGNSRFTPETLERVKNVAMAAFGNKAYANLVNGEKAWKGIIRDVKGLIVVKSMVVPVGNFLANMTQLIGMGMSPVDLVKNTPKIIMEVSHYAKGQIRLVQAEAELRAAESAKDQIKQTRLKAEMQGIKDSWKRLSTWPLLEKGGLGTISTEDGELLSGGKLDQFLGKLVEKLPEGMQTAGRYALVSKDTALYQGLERAITYGDFLAKALYYQHLTEKRKFSSVQALGKSTEAFDHFDRLPGRGRGYTEQMGMAWFYNFKLRSAKVAMAMLRENPLQTLLTVGMGDISPVSLDGPLQENVFSKGFEGLLGHSISPLMAFRAWRMFPLAQILF